MPESPAEWIEHHRQTRVEEGVSLAEQDMLTALAGVVLVDKLSRASMGEVSAEGRSSFVFHGEPTEAEQHWSAMQAQRKETR